MSSGNSSAHWCKGVLEEVQASTQSNSNPYSYPSYQSYPYLQGYTPSPVAPSQPPSHTPTLNSPAVSANDYYRQYYEYYTRYYYGQNPATQSTQSNSQSLTPPTTQSATPVTTPISTDSAYSYTPPSNSVTQTTYSSAPISYAAAVLKGQNPMTAPSPAPVQPQKKPNPSRFSQAPPPPPQAVVPRPPAPVTQSTPPLPRPTPVATQSLPSPTPPPQNNSSSPSPWPPTLKAFVEKSFSRCETDADRAYVEDKLKSLIAKVSNDGRMHRHKWELEPIPIPPSQLPKPVLSTTDSKDEVKEPKRKKSRFQPIEETSSPRTEIKSNQIVPAIITSKEEINRQNRANRFMREHNLQKHQPNKKPQNSSSVSMQTPLSGGYSDSDLESFIVIGTCQKVEKDYFRLTSAPDPSTVRPLEVLKKAFELVKEKWNQSRPSDGSGSENDASGSGSSTSYVWLCSQLKSIRQDVMVQHIKNGLNFFFPSVIFVEFTVNVYELHGRIALQCGDLNEYNQCQTQLKQLYASGLIGSEMEFTAYRILYYLYLQGNSKYQKGNQDIANIMSTLSHTAMSDPAIHHALELRKAISLDNYHHFFRLYQTTPNLGKFILEKMMDSWRVKALQRMVKTYRPTLELEFLLSELSYQPSQYSEGIEFITRLGAVITTTSDGMKLLDPKVSIISSAPVIAPDDQLLL